MGTRVRSLSLESREVQLSGAPARCWGTREGRRVSGAEGRGRAALWEARAELLLWTRGSTLAGQRGARAPQQSDTPGVSWRSVGHPDRIPLGEPLTGLFDFCVSLKLK